MTFNEGLVLLSSFAAFSLGAYALLTIGNTYRARLDARLRDLESSPTASPGQPLSAGPLGGLWSRVLDSMRLVDRSKFQRRLVSAGIYDPAALSRYFTARLALVVLPVLVLMVVGAAGKLPTGVVILAAAVTASLGAILPNLWLERAIARHHATLRRSLPDFLDLMIVCLDAGLSLQETIRRVGHELRLAHPALAFELGMVQREVELGATVDHALRHFATRTNYDDVRTLSTFIREARRLGTNITEALRIHADMLRSQREQAAEESAHKAAVKILLPTILLIFPAIFVVLVGPAILQIQEAFAAK